MGEKIIRFGRLEEFKKNDEVCQKKKNNCPEEMRKINVFYEI